MELREALTQISEIRQRVAQAEVFRGYRSVPVAFSGLLALATAGVQSVCLPQPAGNAAAYLALWVTAALVSMSATGLELFLHHRHARTPLAQQLTWLAHPAVRPLPDGRRPGDARCGQLCLGCILDSPGLWSMLFSLGIFASYRLLPKPTFWVATFYMIAGAMLLTLREDALSPWAMGIPFGGGQLFAAAVLYWTLERPDVEPQEQEC